MTDDYTEFWRNDNLKNIVPVPNPEGWDVPAFLRELLSDHINDTIIDFGCGYGRNTQAFDSEMYLGVDINPEAIDKARENNPDHEFEVCEFISDIPTADVAMAYTVLLHISDNTIDEVVGHLTDKADCVLVAEILGRKWRHDGKVPVFNREQSDYDTVFGLHGYSLVSRTDKPYKHYHNTNISFLIYKKAEPAKYSFLMPYFVRSKQLYNTLVSFRHHYGDRSDYEVIIVEDGKNDNIESERSHLSNVIASFPDIRIRRVVFRKEACNPSGMFNLGSAVSAGEYLVLTNPEVMHEGNVLEMFDDKLSKNPGAYIVCSCKSIHDMPRLNTMDELNYTFEKWYVHREHKYKRFHFCSALKKSTYDIAGGFDEQYMDGVAFEDADFLHAVEDVTDIILDDTAIVLHQFHGKTYSDGSRGALTERNRKIYEKKWGSRAYQG